MEFGGFIGGFGKIFFTKGRIKRGFGVFLGWRNLYFFKNFQRGGEEFETLWVNVFLGYGLGREREKGKGIGFLG